MQQFVEKINLYLFNPPVEKEEIQKVGLSITECGLIYILSLISRSIGYSLITQSDIFSFIFFLLTNFIFSIITIFIFLLWVLFIASVSKKEWEFYNVLSITFVSHSPFFLLLPVSLVCFYFDIRQIYFLVEFIIFVNVISKIFKNVKTYFKFSKIQMFILVLVPIFAILAIGFLSIISFILLVYNKIQLI